MKNIFTLFANTCANTILGRQRPAPAWCGSAQGSSRKIYRYALVVMLALFSLLPGVGQAQTINYDFATVGQLDGNLKIDASGYMYMSSGSQRYVKTISPSGVVSSYYMGFNEGGPALDPSGIFYQSSKYYESSGQSCIHKLTTGGVVTYPWVIFQGSQTGGAKISSGSSLVFDAFSGNLFAVDESGNVYKISPTGIISYFSNVGSMWPTLVPDGFGNFYYLGAGICKINSAGVNTTSWGPTLNSGEYWSYIMKIDNTGNIYAYTSSTTSPRILKIAPDGTIVNSWSVNVRIGEAAFDPSGNLYFLDYDGNQRYYISKIAADGVYTKYAVEPHSNSTIIFYSGLVCDNSGSLYTKRTDGSSQWRICKNNTTYSAKQLKLYQPQCVYQGHSHYSP